MAALKANKMQDLGAGSVINSAHCSSIKLEFDSHHPCWAANRCLELWLLGIQCLLLAPIFHPKYPLVFHPVSLPYTGPSEEPSSVFDTSHRTGLRHGGETC